MRSAGTGLPCHLPQPHQRRCRRLLPIRERAIQNNPTKLIVVLCCGSGLAEGSPSHNFIADVPFMVGIVESILTERFLP